MCRGDPVTLGSWRAVSRTPTPWRKVLRFKCRFKPVFSHLPGPYEAAETSVWEGLLCSDKLLSATSPCPLQTPKLPHPAPPRRDSGSLCFWRVQSPFVSCASKTTAGLPASAGRFWVAWAWHKGFWGRRRVLGHGDQSSLGQVCKHLVPTVSATVGHMEQIHWFISRVPSNPRQMQLTEVRELAQSPRRAPQHFFLSSPPAGSWCRAVRSHHC